MDIFVDFSYFKKHYIDSIYYNKLKTDYKGKTLKIPEQYQVLEIWYKSEYDNLVKRFDQKKLDQLKRDMNNFHAHSIYVIGGEGRSATMTGYRDSVMSVNVADLIKGNSIIWAHNAHVIKSGLRFNLFKAKNLGSYLNDKYGDDYYCILTDFTHVATINAQPADKFKPRTYTPNRKSLSYQLMNKYALEEGMIFKSILKEFDLKNYATNTIGLEGRKIILNGSPNSFDVLVVFSNISPSQILFE